MTPLGSEVRRIRSLRGMTLRQHAERVGVSAAYLSSLENGYRGVPTEEMLQRIIDGLQISPLEAERLKASARFSDPKVKVDTSGLTPLATEAANLLMQKIRTMNERELWEIEQLLLRARSKRPCRK